MASIDSSTIDFLKQLSENNNREWFAAHKAEYEVANQNVKAFIEALIVGLHSVDPHIPLDIKASKCLFRIYRDIRFSKEKIPYKTWFAAGISIDGRKLEGPEYYIHIGAEESFIACGYWRPEKKHLEMIRQEIDYSGQELKKILNEIKDPSIQLSEEDMLKRAPAGYVEENEYLSWIKLKSFVLDKKMRSEEFLLPDSSEQVLHSFREMLPFKNFLHQAIE